MSSKGHIQTVANQGSEGRQEETLLQQGAWCWSLLGWCASSLYMSLSSSAGTRAPSTQMEEVTAGWAKQVDPHWLERLMAEMGGTRPCYLTTNQSEGCSTRCSPCPWILSITLPQKPLGSLGSLNISFLFSLVGPYNKTFFAPNTVISICLASVCIRHVNLGLRT